MHHDIFVYVLLICFTIDVFYYKCFVVKCVKRTISYYRLGKNLSYIKRHVQKMSKDQNKSCNC